MLAFATPTEFWEATERGEFVLATCAECGKAHPFPVARCGNCASTNVYWRPAPTDATLYSWTTTYRQLHAAFPEPPYRLGVIELRQDGEHWVHWISGLDPAVPEEELAIGVPMRLTFRKIGERTHPLFVVGREGDDR